MKLNPFKKRQPPPGRQRQPSDLQPAPSVFSYRSQRDEDQPGRAAEQRQQRKRSRSWLQRFGLLIMLVVLVATAISILSLSSKTTVKVLPTASRRPLLQPLTTYQASADSLMADSIWNRSKISIDQNKLAKKLEQRHPELAGVTVTLPLLSHRPVVYIEPANPALVMSANGYFIISDSGKVLASTVSGAAERLDVPSVNDQSGLILSLNTQALPSNQVSFIKQVVAQLEAKQLTISGLTLPKEASELHVQLDGKPFYVKFNLQSNNPRGQAGTFLATFAELNRRNITPAKYVDVRVDGRAYYQ